jgi:hypothetical protein
LGHLQLYLHASFLAWFTYILGFRVEIDGKVMYRRWGWHTFELPAGPHRVRCWWRWMLIPWAREEITIIVAEDQVTRVAYEAGQFWGEIRLVNPPLAEVPEARLLPAKNR